MIEKTDEQSDDFQDAFFFLDSQMADVERAANAAKMSVPEHHSARIREGEGILKAFDEARIDAPVSAFELDQIALQKALPVGATRFANKFGGQVKAFRLAVWLAAESAQTDCRVEALKLRDGEHRKLLESLFGTLRAKSTMLDETPASVTMAPNVREKWMIARDRARDLWLALEDVMVVLPKPPPRGATEDFANLSLVRHLACMFEKLTGVKAGQTAGGPFARFAIVAFKFLQRDPPPESELETWLGGIIERGAWKKSRSPQAKSAKK